MVATCFGPFPSQPLLWTLRLYTHNSQICHSAQTSLSSRLQKATSPWIFHKQHKLTIYQNELVFCINLFPVFLVPANGPIIHSVAQIRYLGGLFIPPHFQLITKPY